MTSLNIGKMYPDLYQAVTSLHQKTIKHLADTGISEGFTHLLMLRASLINSCAFCIRMHANDAISCGETLDRITLLNAWHECDYFTDAEKTALKIVEHITLISSQPNLHQSIGNARAYFNDQQIAAIEWLAIVINMWNRIAISSRYSVKP